MTGLTAPDIKAIFHLFPRWRVRPVQWTLGFLIFLIGCGSITVDAKTEVLSPTEVTHGIHFQATGEIARFFLEESETGDGDPFLSAFCVESATIKEDEEMSLSYDCQDITHRQLIEWRAENEVPDSSAGNIKIGVQDRGSYWEYKAQSFNLFHDGASEQNNADTLDLPIDEILDVRHKWSLNMPGEIVRHNATLVEQDGTLIYEGDFEGPRLFFATSRVQKTRVDRIRDFFQTNLFDRCNSSEPEQGS
jgi:hypothetical protein